MRNLTSTILLSILVGKQKENVGRTARERRNKIVGLVAMVG